MTELVRIDARSFKKFSSTLRKAAPELAVGMRVKLKAAGQIVADDAKSRSAYSTRIPGSIRVSIAAGKVTIVAGGAKAPDAGPLENKGLPGSFRHPVFGNRAVWVAQQARPFLHPALEAKKDEAMAAVAETLVETIETIAAESEV